MATPYSTSPPASQRSAARRWRALKRALGIHPEDFPYIRLRRALPAWRTIGTNSTVLSWIQQGFRLPFHQPPWPFDQGNSIFTGEDLMAWNTTLTRYLRLGALRPAAHSSHISRAFMVPKPDGSRCLIVDLRPLNASIQDRRLRMQGLRHLANALTPGDSMMSWDIEDAYFHLALHPSHVRYCTIRVNHRLWEIPVLPFGLKTSPYAFTKMVAAFVKFLRAPRLTVPRCPPPHWPGLRQLWMENAAPFVLPYIDDFLASMSRAPQLQTFSNHLVPALRELGLTLKASKSTLTPTTEVTHLGFQVNAGNCTFSVPASRLQQVRREGLTLLALAARQARFLRARLLARFLDRVAFLSLAVRPAQFYTRNLHRDLATKKD